MKRKISNFLILSLVVGMLAAAFYQEDLAGQLSYVAGQMLAEQEEFVVVIDPGHGGMDGGARWNQRKRYQSCDLKRIEPTAAG